MGSTSTSPWLTEPPHPPPPPPNTPPCSRRPQRHAVLFPHIHVIPRIEKNLWSWPRLLLARKCCPRVRGETLFHMGELNTKAPSFFYLDEVPHTNSPPGPPHPPLGGSQLLCVLLNLTETCSINYLIGPDRLETKKIKIRAEKKEKHPSVPIRRAGKKKKKKS